MFVAAAVLVPLPSCSLAAEPERDNAGGSVPLARPDRRSPPPRHERVFNPRVDVRIRHAIGPALAVPACR